MKSPGCLKSGFLRVGNSRRAAKTYHQLGMLAEEHRDFGKAREWYLKSLSSAEKQGNLWGAAITYLQLGNITRMERDFKTAQSWYLKSLAILESLGDLHHIAITCANLARRATLQRAFEDGSRWQARAVVSFQQAGDQHGVEARVSDFHCDYVGAPPTEREKMKAIWFEAGLGNFVPEERDGNLLLLPSETPPEEREKLKAIFLEAMDWASNLNGTDDED